MQIRSFRGSGEPARVIALSNARDGLGPDPRRALGPAAIRAASTGRTRDRTRPMLQKRQKVLARAPSTRDPLLPSAIQSSCVAVFLFDRLVRAQQDRCRHIEAKRLGGRHIEHGLVFHRQLHRQIGRLLALKDAVDVGGGAASMAYLVRPI
jgi:hypothetical protein